MSKCSELKDLVEKEVLPELIEYVDSMYEAIANNKKATLDDKEDLKEINELRDELAQMLIDLNANEIDDEECAEIHEELMMMREEE